METNRERRLIGVKSIAKYLDLSVSSVYRWEKTLGLPLHRVGHKDGYTVYVEKDELDDWLANSGSRKINHKAKFKKYIILAIATISILMISVLLILNINRDKYSEADNRPKSVALRSNTLVADKDIQIAPELFIIDQGIVYAKALSGKVLWSYRIDKRKNQDEYLDECMSVDDIDKDGFKEVATRIHDLEDDRFFLCLFDHDGKVLWKRGMDSNQTFNNLKISDNYRCEAVKLALAENDRTIVISMWRNRVRFLSIIACHDLDGDLLYKYLNIGHLNGIKLHDLDGDGVDEIIFAGTNNLLNGEGILGVLSLTGFHGISPPSRVEPEYADLSYRLSIYVPDNPNPGNQLVYIRFKRNGYLQKYQNPHIFAEILNINQGTLNVVLSFTDYKKSPSLVFCPCFVFDKVLNLKYVFPTGGLVKFYPDFLERGEIDIPLEGFLDVFAANIFRWEDAYWIPNPSE